MNDQEQFPNRPRKMDRHTGKWARRQGISCYRVYDADLPSHPLVIDRYADWVHLAEYKRDVELDEHEYRTWRFLIRETITEVMDVPASRIVFKERAPQKGDSQYIKQAATGMEIPVQEGGLTFLVNLRDYLDTGLFLDHRQTRAMVRDMALGKRFLNLFAYTGSFTVYAAAGGARSSLTLDLSNTYLEWAQRNLEANGLSSDAHVFQRVDVLEWLRVKPQDQWDLIVMDPPTFSNSKMMRAVLDVQRDHIGLIEACVMRLARGGTLIFSTNHRRFKLEEDRLPGGIQVKNITGQTIPQDFRNKKIHQCWMIRKEG